MDPNVKINQALGTYLALPQSPRAVLSMGIIVGGKSLAGKLEDIKFLEALNHSLDNHRHGEWGIQPKFVKDKNDQNVQDGWPVYSRWRINGALWSIVSESEYMKADLPEGRRQSCRALTLVLSHEEYKSWKRGFDT